MNLSHNQVTPGLTSKQHTFKARYWPYVGTTTACPVGRVAVVDTGACGAYNPSGTARSAVAGTPDYAADGSWTDPCANMCLPNNTSAAVMRKCVAAVLISTDPSAVSSTQLAAGEYGTWQSGGRCVCAVVGHDDNSSTGAAIIAGDLLTVSFVTANAGYLRKAKATDRACARAISSSAGATTGNIVGSGSTANLIVEMFGDEVGAVSTL